MTRTEPDAPRTLLICHHDAALDQLVIAPWLSSFSNLVGVLVLRENGGQRMARIRRELRRSGLLRFADVLAFRAYYRLALAKRDREWEAVTIERFRASLPTRHPPSPVLVTHSANSEEAYQFIRTASPHMVIARCKQLLRPKIFNIPPHGTWVMHPGICPEYRNAHGCFWALAERDLSKVGLTLLRVDDGVDTGPVYGYYSYDFDEVRESHQVIQSRVVLENLEPLKLRLLDVYHERARPVETSGRPSRVWGQPRLTRHLSWKWRARRHHR